MEKVIYNYGIKSEKVFVIGADGEKIGEMDTKKAIRKALDLELDLVLISVGKGIPTAKITDRGKYAYEQKRREREKQKKARQKAKPMKELRISANIADNDMETKKKLARKFLADGHEVKFTLVCRGREISKIHTLSSALYGVSKSMADCAVPRGKVNVEGRRASLVLCPV